MVSTELQSLIELLSLLAEIQAKAELRAEEILAERESKKRSVKGGKE
jgi:hypothetical protein